MPVNYNSDTSGIFYKIGRFFALIQILDQLETVLDSVSSGFLKTVQDYISDSTDKYALRGVQDIVSIRQSARSMIHGQKEQIAQQLPYPIAGELKSNDILAGNDSSSILSRFQDVMYRDSARCSSCVYTPPSLSYPCFIKGSVVNHWGGDSSNSFEGDYQAGAVGSTLSLRCRVVEVTPSGGRLRITAQGRDLNLRPGHGVEWSVVERMKEFEIKQASSPSNLAYNGGFEISEGSTAPKGWACSGAWGTNAVLSQTNAARGSRCVKFLTSGTYILQKIDSSRFVPGKNYFVLVLARTGGAGTTATLALQLGYASISGLSLGTSYDYRILYNTPLRYKSRKSGETDLKITCTITGGQDGVFIDEVMVIPGEEGFGVDWIVAYPPTGTLVFGEEGLLGFTGPSGSGVYGFARMFKRFFKWEVPSSTVSSTISDDLISLPSQ